MTAVRPTEEAVGASLHLGAGPAHHAVADPVVHGLCAREVFGIDEAGRVTGVIATAEDGSRTLFKAAKGVIVCTGSYAGNAAMVKKFQQEKVAKLLEEGNVYTVL